MADQTDKEFTATNPVDFTDALKWYAIAQEKQKDYENTYQKLKEQIEMNRELHKELIELKEKLLNVQTDANTEISNLRDNRRTNAEYLVHLLRDAGRNVRELRVVFREPDPWDEDGERII